MARKILIRSGVLMIGISVSIFLFGLTFTTSLAYGNEVSFISNANQKFLQFAEFVMTSLSPTAHAAVRSDHGLPMTNVPYRYSAYAFLLAIALSNLYLKARGQREWGEYQT